MSLETDLHSILDSVTISPGDRGSYTEDFGVIRDYIIQEMKKDSEFRNYFRGTSLCGSYLDDLKIDLPDEYDVCIILDPPSSLTPVKHGAGLLLKAQKKQQIIWTKRRDDGYYYVSREEVQQWMRKILRGIFHNHTRSIDVPTGRKYQVQYSEKSGYAVAHTFTAKSSDPNQRIIDVDFVPAFEFGYDQSIFVKKYSQNTSLKWFAVPSPNKGDEFEFKISAPYFERELIKDKNNLKNSIRLLKALKDHNDMTAMQSYVLKTVVLWENEVRPLNYWQKPMGEILTQMIESLLKYMKKGHLPFFWETSINLLDRVEKAHKLKEYETNFENILKILRGYKSKKELMEIFGVNV